MEGQLGERTPEDIANEILSTEGYHRGRDSRRGSTSQQGVGSHERNTIHGGVGFEHGGSSQRNRGFRRGVGSQSASGSGALPPGFDGTGHDIGHVVGRLQSAMQ